jgi:hypothetical protein
MRKNEKRDEEETSAHEEGKAKQTNQQRRRN